MKFFRKKGDPLPKHWMTVSFNFYTLPDKLSDPYKCTSYEYQYHQGKKAILRDFVNRLGFTEGTWFNQFKSSNIQIPNGTDPEIFAHVCTPVVKSD